MQWSLQERAKRKQEVEEQSHNEREDEMEEKQKKRQRKRRVRKSRCSLPHGSEQHQATAALPESTYPQLTPALHASLSPP